MTYMLKDEAEMICPGRLCPEARSAVILLAPCASDPLPECPPGYGRVARYAWGRDYHKALKRAAKRLVGAAEKALGRSIVWRFFSDSVPLLERAFAERSGAGFVGRNSMLIRPGIGSNFLISELLWDVPLEFSEGTAVFDRGCGECRRCLTACPGRCLHDISVEGQGASRLDARGCISYLTIEKRGPLAETEGRQIGEWVFGCDICQICCPFNHRLSERIAYKPFPELQASHGPGAVLELAPLFGLQTRGAFERIFAGTALMRAGREGILRNAAFVAANTGALAALPAIIDAGVTDPSKSVREACSCAIKVLRG